MTLVIPLKVAAQIVPPDAIVEGRSYADWSAEWWKWVFSCPTNENPLFDTDGSQAANCQPGGNVFFLAGILSISGEQTRAFEVPEGEYLFFPLINFWVDNVGTDPPFTIAKLREFAAEAVASVSMLHASIDGIHVPNLFDYRAISPLFSIEYTFPDNIHAYLLETNFIGTVDPVVADGYFLMLEPLPLGEHVIRYGGSSGSPIDFTLDITAHITVVPASPESRVAALAEAVAQSRLPHGTRRALRATLEAAGRAFRSGRESAATGQLNAFQQQVRARVAPGNPTLAGELREAARMILEQLD